MSETTVGNELDLPNSIPSIDQSAHLLGNYHKYYTFHSVQSRIDQLQNKSLFYELWKSLNEPKDFYIMDIGCNEGDLSVGLWNLVKSELPTHVRCHVVGVDLDPELMNLANNKHTSTPNEGIVTEQKLFECVDFSKESDVSLLRLKLSSQQLSVPIPHFHLITIFSTTMWIHINHGDNGLKQFLIH